MSVGIWDCEFELNGQIWQECTHNKISGPDRWQTRWHCRSCGDDFESLTDLLKSRQAAASVVWLGLAS